MSIIICFAFAFAFPFVVRINSDTKKLSLLGLHHYIFILKCKDTSKDFGVRDQMMRLGFDSVSFLKDEDANDQKNSIRIQIELKY